MAKINLTINLDDEVLLDDAARQAIRGQVRKIVQNEIESNLRREIAVMVDSYIDRIVKAIKSTGWYTSDKLLRDTLQGKILEKAAELSITTDSMKRMVDDFMKPVVEYANQKAIDFQKQEKEMDAEIANQIRRRVDALFKTTLTAALAEALIKNGGQ